MFPNFEHLGPEVHSCPPACLHLTDLWPSFLPLDPPFPLSSFVRRQPRCLLNSPLDLCVVPFSLTGSICVQALAKIAFLCFAVWSKVFHFNMSLQWPHLPLKNGTWLHLGKVNWPRIIWKTSLLYQTTFFPLLPSHVFCLTVIRVIQLGRESGIKRKKKEKQKMLAIYLILSFAFHAILVFRNNQYNPGGKKL